MVLPFRHSGKVPLRHRQIAMQTDFPLFVVYPGPVFGWQVASVGGTQSHTFSDKHVAINYAKSWAEAHRPARVRVEDEHGRIEMEWTFEPYRRPGDPDA
jgi:hypothetical protein